ncbi:MAG TPA: TatD family hydrolase [Anaerolineales bacterium]
MTFTDTHCHLDLDRFDADRGSVLERAAAAGVTRILVPSLDVNSARRIVALVAAQPGLYAAVGYHPTELPTNSSLSMADLDNLARMKRVVAIGEIGLDYYWIKDEPRREKQRSALRSQLDLAEARTLPVILHMREEADASDGQCSVDMLRILEAWVARLHQRNSSLAARPGVLHSFSGSLATARAAIAMGFCIGITGPITYSSSADRRELVRQLPIEHLLIETDSPFLAPQPHRGKRNEPAFVVYIADRIAEIQLRTPEEVAKATSGNAARLFAWGDPD